MKVNYIHIDVPEISSDFLKEGDILIKTFQKKTPSEVVQLALLSIKIARFIGIRSPGKSGADPLPYDAGTDKTIFPCPLAGAMVGRQIYFLRGWKQFESCIKGANALGLMAEQLWRVLRKLEGMPMEGVIQAKRDFLRSRRSSQAGGGAVFQSAAVDAFSLEQLSDIHLFELALWMTFAKKTIVCSTSSNMGISLHDALRSMQAATVSFSGKEFRLLNEDEGRLIIWCPADDADFMNPEKSAFLRQLQAQKPPLTTLRTYINRQQRDPGALKDALLCGGYFFPTNPQSKDELQNLLFVALTNIASERRIPISKLVQDPGIGETLESLGVELLHGKAYVTEGVEAGIAGLTVPYLLMLEELFASQSVDAISVWNQASIGAALAAAVKIDMILRRPELLSEQTRSDMNSLFPSVCEFLDHRQLGTDVLTSVHGVFDIGNMQSLAQLLGVVVEKHLSGRQTAYVGLGSSSYSNGNRCYEILKQSFDGDGPFPGKSNFHPSTHAINPLAQALIYGEDVYRCVTSAPFQHLRSPEEQAAFVLSRVRKPEPAGAAAYAGYLLARLDSGTFSLIEMAYVLRLMGFTKNVFLAFLNLPADEQGVSKLLQECYEEGPYMGDLIKNVLLFLDWPIEDLSRKASRERAFSRLKYILFPLDASGMESANPAVVLYLTGDNTRQPDLDFLREIVRRQLSHLDLFKRLVGNDPEENPATPMHRTVSFVNGLLTRLSSSLRHADRTLSRVRRAALHRLVARQIRKLDKQRPAS